MKKPCICGCGQLVNNRFKKGHKAIWEKNWDKKCACNCGETTSPGHNYVVGHTARVVTKEEYAVRGRKIRAAWKANPLTEEQRKHRSAINTGKNNPAYGKPVSEEVRKKRGESIKKKWADPEYHAAQTLRLKEAADRFWSDPEKVAARKVKRGPEHWSWKGGVAKLGRGAGWTGSSRRHVKARDGYKCAGCGKREQDLIFNLSIHHIDFNRYNHKFTNLVSLCRSCHGRVNGCKEESTQLFTEYINTIYSNPDILDKYSDYDPVQARLEAIRAVVARPGFQAKIQRRKGALHPHYNNSSSGTHLGIPYSAKLKWQEKIFNRDKNTCQLCNKTEEANNIVLGMHHINYIKTDFRDENLITLCIPCNNKSSWDRKGYEELFTKKVNEILKTDISSVGIEPGKKEYTADILNRDNSTCKICYRNSDETKLGIYRIDKDKDYSYDNLVTLCHTCGTNKLYRRKEFWKKTLSEIVTGKLVISKEELHILESQQPIEIETSVRGIGTRKLEELRKKIKARDKICVNCGEDGSKSELCMTYINKTLSDYREENLVTLCRSCNRFHSRDEISVSKLNFYISGLELQTIT